MQKARRTFTFLFNTQDRDRKVKHFGIIFKMKLIRATRNSSFSASVSVSISASVSASISIRSTRNISIRATREHQEKLEKDLNYRKLNGAYPVNEAMYILFKGLYISIYILSGKLCISYLGSYVYPI